MSTRIWILIGSLILLSVFAPMVDANVLDKAGINVIVSIPQVLWVGVNTPTLVFEGDDFDITKNAIAVEDGILAIKPGAIGVVVAGNIGHALFISLDDGLNGPGNTRIPGTRMGYRITDPDGNNPWFVMQSKAEARQALLQRATPGRTAFEMDFHLLVTWWDAPGVYEGTIIYTVVPAEL